MWCSMVLPLYSNDPVKKFYLCACMFGDLNSTNSSQIVSNVGSEAHGTCASLKLVQ